ncbi:retrovirus-related pol polyprotein from transposon TNT 1-94 [Tanacetum coccineum]
MVKSWLVQDQTILGKDYSNLLIADSLLKTIWFINAPCYGNKALASPKANGVCSNSDQEGSSEVPKLRIEAKNQEKRTLEVVTRRTNPKTPFRPILAQWNSKVQYDTTTDMSAHYSKTTFASSEQVEVLGNDIGYTIQSVQHQPRPAPLLLLNLLSVFLPHLLPPIRNSDFHLEVLDAFLALDSIPIGIYNEIFDAEGDIVLLEKLLNIDSIRDLPPQELNNDFEGDILFLEKLLKDEPSEAKKSKINPLIREPADTLLMGNKEIKLNPLKEIDDPVPIPRVSKKSLDFCDLISKTFDMTITNPLFDFNFEFTLNSKNPIFDIQNEESDESETETIIEEIKMTTLAEHIIVVGAENRPPMLEKSMNDSWSSCIRVLIKGKKHGRIILDSIDNGLLVYPTVKENGKTRPMKYSELTEAQQLQDDCDVQAINIILHGLLPDVYALANNQEAAKDIWDRLINDMHTIGMTMQQVQVNTKFLNALPSEWSKFVTDVKLAKSLYTTNYDQLYAYLSLHERQANEVCIMREKYPDPFALVANSPTLYNPFQSPKHSLTHQSQAEFPQLDSSLVVPMFQQGEYLIECINKAMAFLSVIASRFPPSNNQLRTSSDPRNQATIQDAEAQEAGQILDEEQLAFLAEPRISEAPVAQQTIPQNSVFQTEDLDTYDSDCDDLSSAKSVLMTNILSCDPEVLSEVPYSDSYPNDMIIMMGKRCKSQDAVIQDTNSSASNDLLVLSLVEQMTDHVAHLDKENQTNKMSVENSDLNAQLQEKVFSITALKNELRRLKGKNVVDTMVSKPNATIAPGTFKLDIEPISHRLKNNKDAHETCPNSPKPSEKLLVVTPMNKDKSVRLAEPVISLNNIPKQTDSLKTKDSNKPLLTSTGVKPTTSASGSKPLGNTKNNRISRPPSSNQKNKVEDHSRKVKSSLNKMNCVFVPVNNALVKHFVRNAKFEYIYAISNKCLFDANHDMCIIDYVNDVNMRLKSKSKRNKMRKVWKPTGKVVQIVLWYLDSGSSKHMTGNCSQLINLVSKFLGTVRFGNDHIAKIMGYEDYQMGIVQGLPKLKYQKDHLCSACALSKNKKHSHKDNTKDSIQEKLYLLHMDLCGPMRVQSINGRKYKLVIVDDISRTDNRTEFVNQTLGYYYEEVRILHQTSVARTPQQNGVVERQNRTLVEAARTMLIFSKAPLFLCAKEVTIACYTQNQSLI